MWRDLIRHAAGGEVFREYGFGRPAPHSGIEETERSSGLSLPTDLASLLHEMDGVQDQYGDFIWSHREILERNTEFRSFEDLRELYMPFDHLLLFAEAGSGDLFAYPVQAGAVRRPDVFVWDHENDSRTWIAPSLATFLEWRLTGRLDV